MSRSSCTCVSSVARLGLELRLTKRRSLAACRTDALTVAIMIKRSKRIRGLKRRKFKDRVVRKQEDMKR